MPHPHDERGHGHWVSSLKAGVPSLVQLALCLSQAGTMAAFRKALREVLKSVVVRIGMPPKELVDHRRSILDLSCAGQPAPFCFSPISIGGSREW